jgi:hypothetical protein
MKRKNATIKQVSPPLLQIVVIHIVRLFSLFIVGIITKNVVNHQGEITAIKTPPLHYRTLSFVQQSRF